MKVDFRNIDRYLKENPSKNTCGHKTNDINLKEFKEIGNLYDDSFGYLSYLAIKTDLNTEEFVGAYPLQDCKVFECEKCKQVIFFHFNDGWIAPRPEYFLADYEKDYLSEPAVKSASLDKDKYDIFISTFNLQGQDKAKNHGFEPFIIISDKSQRYLFNYREYNGQNGLTSNFDIVGNREFLKEVNDWLIWDGKKE